MAPNTEDYPLYNFIAESNTIENIRRRPTEEELIAHKVFLALPEITVEDIEDFVTVVAGAHLRVRPGMNVQIGAHVPPLGGPKIRTALEELLMGIYDTSSKGLSPWKAHNQYETLHPFMDGNGRSGRVLWAWHMKYTGHDPFILSFLHRFYYQTLFEGR